MANSAFNPIPSEAATRSVTVNVTASAPANTVISHPVLSTGDLPANLGTDRAKLERLGFTGKAGQHIVLPQPSGTEVVLVGVGDDPTVAGLRDAAAIAARAINSEEQLTLDLTTVTDQDLAQVAAAVVEGAILGRYCYEEMRSEAKATPLTTVTLVVGDQDAQAARTGADRGLILARAGAISRDLANAPAKYLNAPVFADVARRLGETNGLDVTVYDKAALEDLGCGALLGVNAGSTVEPRMIVLKYTPKNATGEVKHLGLVGKGIMYDSGGLSLKPSNDMHAAMKMDMSGAAAVLAAMSVLADLQVPVAVSAFLACTDNMPSGSATKLGDVLVSRSGRTIEVMNTDAEGRLVLADAIALANEVGVDAIVDIATLTGAALMALGPGTAAVLGNDDDVLTQVEVAAELADERVWQLPLDERYRPWLDSDIADIKNIGGSYAGSITAALFLSEWVGDTPWAHLDIAGPMRAESVEAWRTKGATGFGARLLAELAANFGPETD